MLILTGVVGASSPTGGAIMPCSPCHLVPSKCHGAIKARVSRRPQASGPRLLLALPQRAAAPGQALDLQVGPVQLGEGGRTDADDADGMAENDVRGMYMAPCWGSKPDGLGCLPQEDDSSDDSHLYGYPFV